MQEFRVKLGVIWRSVENDSLRASYPVSAVEVEPLGEEEEGFPAFEEERPSSTDLGIGRVSEYLSWVSK